ncbi:hypothetical protein B6N60_03349 [Richelia sinica FACHB-800]|uniref:Uncharacterized protein n=1 Tax=Richelia sinica FACHB-800 TaxID=1357546 RepID=A0A975Y5W2_9NOST|nr:hypothetical protein B6N60_03349 [Richelia sinica FACHB-800]
MKLPSLNDVIAFWIFACQIPIIRPNPSQLEYDCHNPS